MVVVGVLVFSGLSCVTAPPPLLEYNLARAAIQAAQNAEAGRFDPGHMHEAEESFRKAKSLLDDREHELAKSFFTKARIAAEKAENAARAMKRKSGEVF